MNMRAYNDVAGVQLLLPFEMYLCVDKGKDMSYTIPSDQVAKARVACDRGSPCEGSPFQMGGG